MLGRSQRAACHRQWPSLMAGLHTRHEPGAIHMGSAVLEYRINEDSRVMDIEHTRTPPEMRGQGVATFGVGKWMKTTGRRPTAEAAV